MRSLIVSGLAAAATAYVMNSALAQETTLKAVTAFAEKTFYSRGFERFIDKVNADGKGVIQINSSAARRRCRRRVGNALKAASCLANATVLHCAGSHLEAHRAADAGAATNGG
jgi:hypothetical protein